MNLDSLFSMDVRIYNLLVLLKNAVHILQNPRALRCMRLMKELRNSKKSDVVYICGNGPSLQKVDFNSINEDYIVVNDYFRFPNQNEKNPPKYYLILDEDMVSNDPESIERYEGIFKSGINTTFVLNGLLEKELRRDFPKINAYYFCPWGKLLSRHSSFDLSRISSVTWNVVSEAIVLAIYCGYKDIRLLGCDYSLFAQNTHFYSQEQVYETLRVMLFKYSFATHVHYEIAQFAKRNGIHITNMTKASLLDAYYIDKNSEY